MLACVCCFTQVTGAQRVRRDGGVDGSAQSATTAPAVNSPGLEEYNAAEATLSRLSSQLAAVETTLDLRDLGAEFAGFESLVTTPSELLVDLLNKYAAGCCQIPHSVPYSIAVPRVIVCLSVCLSRCLFVCLRKAAVGARSLLRQRSGGTAGDATSVPVTFGHKLHQVWARVHSHCCAVPVLLSCNVWCAFARPVLTAAALMHVHVRQIVSAIAERHSISLVKLFRQLIRLWVKGDSEGGDAVSQSQSQPQAAHASSVASAFLDKVVSPSRGTSVVGGPPRLASKSGALHASQLPKFSLFDTSGTTDTPSHPDPTVDEGASIFAPTDDEARRTVDEEYELRIAFVLTSATR